MQLSVNRLKRSSTNIMFVLDRCDALENAVM